MEDLRKALPVAILLACANALRFADAVPDGRGPYLFLTSTAFLIVVAAAFSSFRESRSRRADRIVVDLALLLLALLLAFHMRGVEKALTDTAPYRTFLMTLAVDVFPRAPELALIIHECILVGVAVGISTAFVLIGSEIAKRMPR